MSRTKKAKTRPEPESPPATETAALHQKTFFDAFSKSEGISDLVTFLKELIMGLIARVANLEQRLVEALNRLLGGVPFEERDFYTTKEFAKAVGLKVPTVQEYLRLGRIEGVRTESGRGGIGEWRIAREEFLRFQNEGLRPSTYQYRHPK